MASFGHLSVQIRINPFSSPDTPSQSYGRFASRWLHLNTFLSKSRPGHFRTQIHLPKYMADLLPYGFIWIPFRPDLDQASFEPEYTFPRLSALLLHCIMSLQHDAVAQIGGASCTQTYETRATAKLAFPLQHAASKCCCGSSLVDIFGSPFVQIWLFSINVTRNSTDTQT